MSDAFIICPGCNKQRPEREDIAAYRRPVVDPKLIERVEAYQKCCNPLCGGEWGTNCWHCHHPKFLKGISDATLFQVVYHTHYGRDEKISLDGKITYWNLLVRLPIDRIEQAAEDSFELLSNSNGADPIRFAETFIVGVDRGSRDRYDEMEPLVLRAAIIQACQLAVCEYCRASAESGETTYHSCVAKPLIEMRDVVLRQLEEIENQPSSWEISRSETG